MNSKQQGGKTHLLRYIMYKHRNDFAYGIGFSNSKDIGDNLDWFPKKFQHTFLTSKNPLYNGEVAFEALINEQKRIPKEQRKPVFVIIDDDRSGFHSEILKLACTQAFKYDIWIWISVHNICDLAAGIREQATNVALFETNTHNSIRASYQSYGQQCKTQKDFEMVLAKNTGDHKFLWRDVKGGKPFECWRCPPVVPKFFMDFGDTGDDDSKKEPV